MEATITLEYKDRKTTQAVAKAVAPDNFKTPKTLKIKTFSEDRQVVTIVNCQGKIATFISTIDDLLFSTTTAEKTLKTIKDTQRLQ